MLTQVSPENEVPVDMVGKAMRILAILSDFPHGASVRDVARKSGYPPSTTHRLLQSLSSQGFVSNDSDLRRYNLGLRVWELGQKVSQARGFDGVTIPILEVVVEETHEAAVLGVRAERQLLFVHSLPSPRPVRIKADPGSRTPLHCTSMGKVLLAFSAPETREELVREIPMEKLTPQTETDRDRLRTELDQVWQQGFATSIEEHDVGVNSIAVPVLDAQGHARAAVGCAAPAARASRDKLADFLPALQKAASSLTLLLPDASTGSFPA